MTFIQGILLRPLVQLSSAIRWEGENATINNFADRQFSNKTRQYRREKKSEGLSSKGAFNYIRKVNSIRFSADTFSNLDQTIRYSNKSYKQ